MLTAFVSCDNNVTITGLSLESDGSYLNAATVTAQLRDANLTTVGSPMTLSYVAASNGNYLGVLPSTTSLTAGAVYYLDITTVSGTADDFRRVKLLARYRTEDD